MRKSFLLAILVGTVLLTGASQDKITVLYKSLNPHSITQHFAFYELFKDTSQGQKALEEGWQLLSHSLETAPKLSQVSSQTLDQLIYLVLRPEGAKIPPLKRGERRLIADLAAHLPNRQLKGFLIPNKEGLHSLPNPEIDVARALCLVRPDPNEPPDDVISTYEAMVDLMALQVLTTLKPTASCQEKIHALNHFLFEELGFRFPPHSCFTKEIDSYSYLPSVLDSRRGVCLGVSILYLCLGQRVGLPLEAITPPGHIYVRCPEGVINIETTARGIHLDSEDYLGLETQDFPPRTLREVIGMPFFNEAALHLQKSDYKTALACYRQAAAYMDKDPLLMELMGFTAILAEQEEEGLFLLKESLAAYQEKGPLAQHKGMMIEDFLNHHVEAEGIAELFNESDSSRSALEKRKESIEALLQKYPQFRAGHYQLALCWLQLHREKEALTLMEKYVQMAPEDPNGRYLIANLYGSRGYYSKAWEHLHILEEMFKESPNLPQSLKDLRRELAFRFPE